MHIVVKNDAPQYPQDLSDFPTLKAIVETVEMYFPVSQVHVHLGRNPDDISATIQFHYKDIENYQMRWEGISVRIARYAHLGNKLHFTMSAKFADEFPFVAYLDVESCGFDYERVFLSLVNGIHGEIKKICQRLLEGNDELVKGLSKKDRRIVGEFHHREYV